MVILLAIKALPTSMVVVPASKKPSLLAVIVNIPKEVGVKVL
ncbi:hypothetical protein ES705_41727 [subsurface metagenome]